MTHPRIDRPVRKEIGPGQQPAGDRLEPLAEGGEVGASARRRVAEVDEHRDGALPSPVAGEEAAVVVLVEPLTGSVPRHLPGLEMVDWHFELVPNRLSRARRSSREFSLSHVSSVVELVRLIECPDTRRRCRSRRMTGLSHQ